MVVRAVALGVSGVAKSNPRFHCDLVQQRLFGGSFGIDSESKLNALVLPALVVSVCVAETHSAGTTAGSRRASIEWRAVGGTHKEGEYMWRPSPDVAFSSECNAID